MRDFSRNFGRVFLPIVSPGESIREFLTFGQLQWAVTLGRYDILPHVMFMSCFRLAPKVGHIERMQRIYGYLSKTKHYSLRFRTDEPNYMHLPDLEYDWTRIYGNVLEEIPKDAPEPLGKSVTTTTFLDANLLHDLITGRSVTAVLYTSLT